MDTCGGTSDHIQVAINGGVYRKCGFDVENIQVGSSATVVQALLAGEVSFALVGAVPVVAAVASGLDLKVINRFNFVMVSVPGLRRPQDLKGKTLAISRLGSGDEFATKEALRRWNVDPDKDVRFLQVGLTLARLAALQSHQVQASPLSPPQIVEVQRMGLNVLADLSDLDVEYAHGRARPYRRRSSHHHQEPQGRERKGARPATSHRYQLFCRDRT